MRLLPKNWRSLTSHPRPGLPWRTLQVKPLLLHIVQPIKQRPGTLFFLSASIMVSQWGLQKVLAVDNTSSAKLPADKTATPNNNSKAQNHDSEELKELKKYYQKLKIQYSDHAHSEKDFNHYADLIIELTPPIPSLAIMNKQMGLSLKQSLEGDHNLSPLHQWLDPYLSSIGNRHYTIEDMMQYILPTTPNPSAMGKQILMVGEPGAGRSTLCKKLAHTWSCSEAKSALHQYDAVLYINAKQLNTKEEDRPLLLTTAISYIKQEKSQLTPEIKYLQDKKVLWIIDDYYLLADNKEKTDKDAIDRFLTTLPAGWNMILSSRSYAHPADDYEHIFTVDGLTRKGIIQYLAYFFKDRVGDSHITALTQIKTIVSSQSSYRSPYYLRMLCVLYDKSPNTFFSPQLKSMQPKYLSRTQLLDAYVCHKMSGPDQPLQPCSLVGSLLLDYKQTDQRLQQVQKKCRTTQDILSIFIQSCYESCDIINNTEKVYSVEEKKEKYNPAKELYWTLTAGNLGLASDDQTLESKLLNQYDTTTHSLEKAMIIERVKRVTYAPTLLLEQLRDSHIDLLGIYQKSLLIHCVDEIAATTHQSAGLHYYQLALELKAWFSRLLSEKHAVNWLLHPRIKRAIANSDVIRTDKLIGELFATTLNQKLNKLSTELEKLKELEKSNPQSTDDKEKLNQLRKTTQQHESKINNLLCVIIELNLVNPQLYRQIFVIFSDRHTRISIRSNATIYLAKASSQNKDPHLPLALTKHLLDLSESILVRLFATLGLTLLLNENNISSQHIEYELLPHIQDADLFTRANMVHLLKFMYTPTLTEYSAYTKAEMKEYERIKKTVIKHLLDANTNEHDSWLRFGICYTLSQLDASYANHYLHQGTFIDLVKFNEIKEKISKSEDVVSREIDPKLLAKWSGLLMKLWADPDAISFFTQTWQKLTQSNQVTSPVPVLTDLAQEAKEKPLDINKEKLVEISVAFIQALQKIATDGNLSGNAQNKYDLCLMTESTKPEKGKIYFKEINGKIAYTVITPKGETVIDIQTEIKAPVPFDLNQLARLKYEIWNVTSKAGHTSQLCFEININAPFISSGEFEIKIGNRIAISVPKFTIPISKNIRENPLPRLLRIKQFDINFFSNKGFDITPSGIEINLDILNAINLQVKIEENQNTDAHKGRITIRILESKDHPINTFIANCRDIKSAIDKVSNNNGAFIAEFLKNYEENNTISQITHLPPGINYAVFTGLALYVITQHFHHNPYPAEKMITFRKQLGHFIDRETHNIRYQLLDDFKQDKRWIPSALTAAELCRLMLSSFFPRQTTDVPIPTPNLVYEETLDWIIYFLNFVNRDKGYYDRWLEESSDTLQFSLQQQVKDAILFNMDSKITARLTKNLQQNSSPQELLLYAIYTGLPILPQSLESKEAHKISLFLPTGQVETSFTNDHFKNVKSLMGTTAFAEDLFYENSMRKIHAKIAEIQPDDALSEIKNQINDLFKLANANTVEEKQKIIDIPDRSGNTLLMHAVEKGSLPLVKYLVHCCGARIDRSNTENKTALQLAYDIITKDKATYIDVKSNNKAKILSYLVEHVQLIDRAFVETIISQMSFQDCHFTQAVKHSYLLKHLGKLTQFKPSRDDKNFLIDEEKFWMADELKLKLTHNKNLTHIKTRLPFYLAFLLTQLSKQHLMDLEDIQSKNMIAEMKQEIQLLINTIRIDSYLEIIEDFNPLSVNKDMVTRIRSRSRQSEFYNELRQVFTNNLCKQLEDHPDPLVVPIINNHHQKHIYYLTITPQSESKHSESKHWQLSIHNLAPKVIEGAEAQHQSDAKTGELYPYHVKCATIETLRKSLSHVLWQQNIYESSFYKISHPWLIPFWFLATYVPKPILCGCPILFILSILLVPLSALLQLKTPYGRDLTLERKNIYQITTATKRQGIALPLQEIDNCVLENYRAVIKNRLYTFFKKEYHDVSEDKIKDHTNMVFDAYFSPIPRLTSSK